MRLTCPRWILVVLLAALPAAGEVLFVSTPYRSLSRAVALLDAADARVLLPMGFALAPELASGAQLARRRGVSEVRVYVPVAGAGSAVARLELGLSLAPGGIYQIAAYGLSAGGLTDLEARLGPLVAEARRAVASPPPPELGYEMLRLGYIEADRALALLKALGYHCVEFNSRDTAKEQIFEVVRGQSAKLPWIIKVANAAKTSLLAPVPGARSTSTRATTSSRGGSIEGAPQLGGSLLHSVTAGAPEERLLLVYDRNRPEDLEALVNLLQTQIDVPSQQIVIEALVIEVNTADLNDLGFEWRSATGSASASFERSSVTGKRQGTFILSPEAFTDFNAFRGALEALEERGQAEVLSSPSVLVLNDRQARIQVGRQIPVSRTTATSVSTIKGVEYFPIGIVLNLRPRIDREQSEVTMQIETIISSISPESAAKLEASAGDVTFSPIVDNRLVETFVRVADGTPFIIGGLLSTNDQQTRIGLPVISGLPWLGRLFTRQRVESERREVIVVLTPHIVPQDARSFSYLIPKDSDLFDRFDYTLFRNAYRVRDDEVWDLKFIQDSPVLRGIVDRIRRHADQDVTLRRREPFASFLAGRIPGEEVLVRCMLKDIVEKLDYGDEIDLEKIFFFENAAPDNLMDRSLTAVLGRLLQTPGRGLVLTYEARGEPREGDYFTYPFATVRDTTVPADDRERILFLRRLNPVDAEEQPLRWSILLADDQDLAHLRNVLILKRLLELNNKLPLTLEAFQPGLQVLFPSRVDMASRYHLIDREVAQLFYETSSSQYYPAFERVFNRRVRQVERILGSTRGSR